MLVEEGHVVLTVHGPVTRVRNLDAGIDDLLLEEVPYGEFTGSLDLLADLDGQRVLIKRSAWFELTTAFFGLAKRNERRMCSNAIIMASLFIISISLSCCEEPRLLGRFKTPAPFLSPNHLSRVLNEYTTGSKGMPAAL